nr:hypothetical protein LSAT_V11C600309510 [Lactuca sativa]KAJ0200104.1 hypothetical protein LSAT_V11C600309520 [Lactuca sativa]KAJ0201137.1 hypothetical protein LSAT_V11C600309500 [Lactuca sativa]
MLYGCKDEKVNKMNHRVLGTLRELFTHYKKTHDKNNEKKTSVSGNSIPVNTPYSLKIVKHVFGMRISIDASDSAFSTGGWVIDKFRSSLTPQTTETLICTQD